MTTKRATIQEMEDILFLEQLHFGREGHRPEVREAYEFVLDHGEVTLAYNGHQPTGMLALLPVREMMENESRMLALPAESLLRRRYERGDFRRYEEYVLVHTFVANPPSHDLRSKFQNQKRLMGFVYEGDEDALKFYERIGCILAGRVENPLSPGKRDYVLTYERDRNL